MRTSTSTRFWSKVREDDGCWIWSAGRVSAGYGVFWADGKTRLAHRLAYEEMVGPVPDGLHLDHLCRRTSGVNPWHLEPVTARENVIRSDGPTMTARRHAATTHCKWGHEFTPDNTYRQRNGGRTCRACALRRAAESLTRKREAA